MADSTTMSVHVEKRFDVVLIDGAKVEYSGALDLKADDTGGLFLDYGDDLSTRRLWYDGKTMTLLDSIDNVYASTAASGPVAEALVQLVKVGVVDTRRLDPCEQSPEPGRDALPFDRARVVEELLQRDRTRDRLHPDLAAIAIRDELERARCAHSGLHQPLEREELGLRARPIPQRLEPVRVMEAFHDDRRLRALYQ